MAANCALRARRLPSIVHAFHPSPPSLSSGDPRSPPPLLPRSVSAENSPCGNPTLGTQDLGSVCLRCHLFVRPPIFLTRRVSTLFSRRHLPSMDASPLPNVPRRTAFSYHTSFSASFRSHCHSSYYRRVQCHGAHWANESPPSGLHRLAHIMTRKVTRPSQRSQGQSWLYRPSFTQIYSLFTTLAGDEFYCTSSHRIPCTSPFSPTVQTHKLLPQELASSSFRLSSGVH
ncbi:uncharacterized protein SCHCODRAFT_02208386 [Schizophyllum commune H4-8]|uniref:uncharacterized protein n=1 Tax=Schizophyllum commune (strain H4-8 / FGSC 9210) TaxID=578458 RepID=UPI00215FE6C8|nr:uncharacterized protein SCHCODRAFT_02208386 [Schizophyllum commune H4-8]KAI5897215.1 hypothetical protein SCHCODRAFT_02208386 [Schizophyllum commune H4-8]